MKVQKYYVHTTLFFFISVVISVALSLAGPGNAIDATKPAIILFLVALIYFHSYPFVFGQNRRYNEQRQFNVLLLLVNIQAIFLIYSYFEPILPYHIGKALGFEVNEVHRRVLELSGFVSGNRAYSIFGNPNIAARVLLITFAFAIWLFQLPKITIALALFAIFASGSRAATIIFVLLNVTALVSKEQFGSIVKYVFLASVFLMLIVTLVPQEYNILFRSLSLDMLDNSLLYKLHSASRVLEGSGDAYIGKALDNDLIYCLVYFNYPLLFYICFSILLLLIRCNFPIFSWIFLYMLSGSLLFSWVNVAVFIVIYIVIRLQFRCKNIR